jgi:acetyl-CoA acetyltransferase
LAGLRTVYDGGVQTAGNSAALVDGAAAMVVASGTVMRDTARAPLARLAGAAAAGVPLRRIVGLTFLPNLVVSAVYAVAASESFVTASAAFLGTVVASGVIWMWVRVAGRRGNG